MKNFKNYVKKIPFAAGFYKKMTGWCKYFSFIKDYHYFKSLQKTARFIMRWRDRYPCLDEGSGTADFDKHYIYHTAWAARILRKINPASHIDISSYIYFSTIMSAFMPVKYYEYRPRNIKLSGFTSHYADLLSLPFKDESIKSISCMHVVEHIGLGRYGEAMDPDADIKAIKELKRVLALGGELLFVVPLGEARIMFNAHRIYSYEHIMEYFKELELREFSLIPDDMAHEDFIKDASPELVKGQRYACGCFWFRKKKND